LSHSQVIQHSKYCDDAFTQKKALKDNDPYDLLISDLSFKIDHRQNRLRWWTYWKFKNIKTIVISLEDKSYRIKSLFNNLGINAYVSKGRNSIPELQNAVETIYRNDENQIALGLNYLKWQISSWNWSLRYFAFEVTINGYILEEISREFAGIIPNGSSSIESALIN
jgi:hypothetical protein